MRILLVDDDSEVGGWLGRLLAAHGHDVRCFSKPAEALVAAAEFRPQGIILDIGMPGVDGYSLCQQLRRLPECADCRIVAVTGYSRDGERLARAGFDQYFQKPVGYKALIDALEPVHV